MADQEVLSKDETIRLRLKHVGPSCTLFFKNDPLKIVRASGQYMFDECGNKYLDCINNVAHVGHCHQDVVRAGAEQMAQLNTNARFLHDNIVLYAQRLTRLLPAPLSVCYFVNSGSEANDLSIRLARAHTKRKDLIVLNHAYHGHLTSVVEMSPFKYHEGIGPANHVHVAPCPDVYRGKYRDTDYTAPELSQLYAGEVQDIIQKEIKSQGRGLCAYFAESFQSCGGQIIYPPGYLRQVYSYVREAGGVCVADEVQVGFGRSGSHFWAFQTQGEDIVPDIVVIGKSMGNGHPVAVVVTTPEIAHSFKNTGIEYFNTYGGNPVSLAVANAVLDVIENEGLCEQAARVSQYILKRLKDLQERYYIIGDVRGMGMFLGVELVKNRSTREPAPEAAEYVIYRLKKDHILLSREGPDQNVLKFKPPLTFNEENVDTLITGLDSALDSLEQIGGAEVFHEHSTHNTSVAIIGSERRDAANNYHHSAFSSTGSSSEEEH